MANNEWPQWLKDTLPEWLSETGYPERGVGDLEDLRLQVAVGEAGRWVGFVRPGWFYSDLREQYHYAMPLTQAVSGTVGTFSATHPTSYRPAWGPVLVESASGVPYVQHHNTFQPGVGATWTPDSGTGLAYTTVPSGAILVGVRDLTRLPLGSVAGNADVINHRFYHYDETTRRLWVRPKDPTAVGLWLDLLYTEPLLRMREIVAQEEDGVRLSYKDVEDLRLYRGDATQAIGSHGSGYVTHSLPSTLEGDWVVASYYVKRSFVLTSHARIDGYGTSALSEGRTVYFEGSLPDILPAATLTNGDALNLNPLFPDSYRAGYLSHVSAFTNPASSLWEPARLLMELDKTSAVGAWREMVKFTLILLDKNDLPIPWYPVTLTYGPTTTLVTVTPAGTTDGRGEIHGLFSLSGAGGSVTATVGGLDPVTRSCLNLAASGVVTDADYLSGTVSLVVEDVRETSRGNRRAYVGAHLLDGIPRAAGIELRSRLTSEIETPNGLTAGLSTVFTQRALDNPFAVLQGLGFTPGKGDELLAVSGTGQSTLLRFGENP